MGTYSTTVLNGITITNASQLPVTITDTGYIGDNTYGGASIDVASTLTGTVFNFGQVKTTIMSNGNRASQRNAILLRGGGYVYNGSSGVVDATKNGITTQGTAVSTIVNFGTVLANNHLGSFGDFNAPFGVGVSMAAGTVTNGSASAHVSLIEGSEIGVSIGGGSGPGTLDNFAIIQVATNANNPGYYGSSFFDGSGVYARYSSTVNNYTGAQIVGRTNGVVASGIGTTIFNGGTISAATADGHGKGIRLTQGGNVSNGGLISGVDVGIGAYYSISGATAGTFVNVGTIVATGASGIGISLVVPGATIINAGTISGGGAAISFGDGSGSTNLLILENGYVFGGAVHGGASSTDVLLLAGTSGDAVTVNYNSLFLSDWDDVRFGAVGYATLDLTNTSGTVGATIQGFTLTSDVIHLKNITNGTISNFNQVDHLVTITGTGGSVTLKLDGSDSSYLSTSIDGLGGTDVSPACFCRGTLIRTPDGEVPVEELRIGDEVVTAPGAARPVKWIGRRAYDPRFVTGNKSVLPIRIAAGALGAGVPARDLYLSPEHAMAIDGVLVPAGFLLNGTTVTQADRIDDILEYFHVELEEHDILFAEGAPAESYVDCDNRLIFANAAEYAGLYPDEGRPRWQFCAPRLEAASPELAVIRERMVERAMALGHPGLSSDPDPCLMVDGKVLRPFSLSPLVHRFTLPAGAHEVWLLSRSTVPAYVEPGSSDTRRLGLPVECLVLRDGGRVHETWHEQLACGEGFHQDDGTHCWTDGRARLPQLRPLARRCTLEVRLIASNLRYPKLPPATAALGTAAKGERRMAAQRLAVAG